MKLIKSATVAYVGIPFKSFCQHFLKKLLGYFYSAGRIKIIKSDSKENDVTKNNVTKKFYIK